MLFGARMGMPQETSDKFFLPTNTNLASPRVDRRQVDRIDHFRSGGTERGVESTGHNPT